MTGVRRGDIRIPRVPQYCPLERRAATRRSTSVLARTTLGKGAFENERSNRPREPRAHTAIASDCNRLAGRLRDYTRVEKDNTRMRALAPNWERLRRSPALGAEYEPFGLLLMLRPLNRSKYLWLTGYETEGDEYLGS